VPPTVSYDQDLTPGEHAFELASSYGYVPAGINPVADYQRQPSFHQYTGPSGSALNPHSSGPLAYQQPMQMYQQSQYIDGTVHTTGLSYSNLASTAAPTQETRYQPQTAFSAPPSISVPSPAANEGWRSDLAAAGLTEALGDLKISHDAVGRQTHSEA